MTGFTPFVCQYANNEGLAEKLGFGICVGIFYTDDGLKNAVLWENVRSPSPSFHGPEELAWIDVYNADAANDDDDDDDDWDDEDDDDEDVIEVDNSVNDRNSPNYQAGSTDTDDSEDWDEGEVVDETATIGTTTTETTTETGTTGS